MLSPADAALVAGDTRLAALALVLDADGMTGWLRDAMPEAGVQSAEARYVRYKPGISCTVAYDLLTDRGPRQGYARAVTEPAATSKLTGLIHPSGTVAFLPFPQDRALPALRLLIHRPGRVLPKLLPARPELWDGAMVTLRYKPERRYVVRLSVPGGQQAVVKCYTAVGYERALRAARAVRPRDPLRLARRIGRSGRHHMAAFSWVHGHGLDVANRGEVREAGVALAALHRQLDPRALGTSQDPHARLQVAAAAVAAILPELEPWACTLVRRIARAQTAGPIVGLHGDWTPDQVVVHRRGVTMLDLDRAHAGDPAADVGQFAAGLHRAALDGQLAPERAAAAVEALVAGYRSAGGVDPRPRLGAWTAAALVQVAVEPFRLRVADWPRAVEALLALAEDALR